MSDGKTPSVSRAEFEKIVATKAQADAAFRARLVADPKAALKQDFGVELPEEIEFHVFQETPSRFCLVLPPVSRELTDEELAQVAGGLAASELQLKFEYPTAISSRLRPLLAVGKVTL